MYHTLFFLEKNLYRDFFIPTRLIIFILYLKMETMSEKLYNMTMIAHTPRGSFKHKTTEGVTMEDINDFNDILKSAAQGELANLKLSGLVPRSSWNRITNIPKELISQSVFEIQYTEIVD